MIHGNLETYFGKPVVDFAMEDTRDDFTDVAIRLRCSYDERHTISDLLSRSLRYPGIGGLEALIFGVFMEGGEAVDVSPDAAIEHLVTERGKLSGLKALFIGDITLEENEFSWINQGNMAPLWSAFPQLEQFTVRGSEGLRLGRIEVLDLSMGTVGDDGAKALATSDQISHLERLDLTHHYMSDDVLAALAQKSPKLVAEEQLEPDRYGDEVYYNVAVSE